MKYLITLLLFVTAAQAQTLKLPTEVRGDPGAFIRVPAETDCKEVRWFPIDRGLNVFPVELLRDSKTAIVTASRPGKYRLLAYTAKGDVPSLPAECYVIVGDVPPGPDPVPPIPPIPPTPSPLTPAFQAAYDKETATDKAASLAKLKSLYGQGAGNVANAENVQALDDMMRSIAAALGVSGKLVGVQQEIRKEVLKVVPTDFARALTPQEKQDIANTYSQIAKGLEGVKP